MRMHYSIFGKRLSLPKLSIPAKIHISSASNAAIIQLATLVCPRPKGSFKSPILTDSKYTPARVRLLEPAQSADGLPIHLHTNAVGGIGDDDAALAGQRQALNVPLNGVDKPVDPRPLSVALGHGHHLRIDIAGVDMGKSPFPPKIQSLLAAALSCLPPVAPAIKGKFLSLIHI